MTVPTVVAGNKITEAWGNTVATDVNATTDAVDVIEAAVMVRTGVILTRITDYTITAGSTQLIAWGGIPFEVGGNWYTTGGTITCPTGCDGVYSVTSINTFGGSFAPLYHVGFEINGVMNWVPGSAVSLDSRVSTVWLASATDTLTVSLLNPSGGSVTAADMRLEVFKISV